MIEFEDLNIDYMDNLPLGIKIAYEREVPLFIERFAYRHDTKTLYIPKKPRIESFSWILSSVNHEFLHHILNVLESQYTSICLDYFDYEDIVSGKIEKRRMVKR
jgi:hypothetical protein